MRLRLVLPVSLLVCLSTACLVGAPDATPATDAAPARTGALFMGPRRVLNIIAHQDDDLSFFGLHESLLSGSTIVSVYITAGDAGYGCQSYVASRETGMLRAYERAAGVVEGAQGWAWSDDSITVHGHTLRRRQTENGQVALLFMGLPNSPFFSGLSLLDLWDKPDLELPTIPDTRRPGVEVYVREELIETLRALLEQVEPEHLGTLDSSRIWPAELPFEHPDHVGSALFALAARQRYTPTVPPSLRLQRGYNQALEISNLPASDIDSRREIFAAYSAHDPVICSGSLVDVCGGDPAPNLQVCTDPEVTYEGFNHVSYTHVPVHNVAGTLRGPGELTPRCLHVERAEAGSVLQLAACAPGALQQQWELLDGDQLRLRDSALCASAVFPVHTRGSAIVLAACDPVDSAQRFLLTSDGKLRAPDASCVELGAEASLHVAECSASAAQRDWVLQVAAPVVTANAAGVSEREIPALAAYYRALGLADVTGDRRADLCERRRDGIWCAAGADTRPASFGAFARWSDALGDAAGWDKAAYGSTVQLVDINGDHAADVCGRGPDGLFCALSNHSSSSVGTGFGALEKRSDGDDFSDARGYGKNASRYGSLRFADLDADGHVDVCARNAKGLECALHRGDAAAPSFAPASAWTVDELGDAQGFGDASTGGTLQLGDVDGDGLPDACARHADGVRCLLNDRGQRFVLGHAWSYTGDFTDRAGWSVQESYHRSIRLVDIDGDGRADVCGRGVVGVLCGLSTGGAFSPLRPLMTEGTFSDAAGFLPAQLGSTLQFADLDADGRPDLCIRAPLAAGGLGVRCVTGTLLPR